MSVRSSIEVGHCFVMNFCTKSYLIFLATFELNKWRLRKDRASNKFIDSQPYKHNRRKIPIAFHSLSNFTLTTTQLNASFLKTLDYFKMIQRLVLSFCNLHGFLLQNKLMTNLELSGSVLLLILSSNVKIVQFTAVC